MSDVFLKLYIKFRSLTSSEDGQDLMEYGFLVMLIALLAISGMNEVARSLNHLLHHISQALDPGSGDHHYGGGGGGWWH